MPLGLPHSEFLSWSEDDQDKALAYRRWKAEECPGCGTRKSKWDADRFAYVAQTERCLGCELISMEHENVPKGEKGIRIFLVLRSYAERVLNLGGEQ